MAAASTVIHNSIASLGSYINVGRSTSVADSDTIDTDLIKVDGFLATAGTNDCVVALSSQSAGVATVRVTTAGAAGSGVTIDWMAWSLPRNS